MQQRLPEIESVCGQMLITECQLLRPESCILAQLSPDIHVQPPVTERQRQIQEARMEQVLHRYASYPQVCLDLVCRMHIGIPHMQAQPISITIAACDWLYPLAFTASLKLLEAKAWLV